MYRQDRQWGDSYTDQVVGILRLLLRHLVVLSVAPSEEDNKRATDFTVKLVGGSIAVRLRRAECRFRDLTIRARRDNGVKTELAKIKEGYASRYFYGWVDDKHNISEWMLVDLDKVRSARLLDREWALIPNGDGTYFIAIPFTVLSKSDCLIASKLLGDAA
jgi:hypothetical protein